MGEKSARSYGGKKRGGKSTPLTAGPEGWGGREKGFRGRLRSERGKKASLLIEKTLKRGGSCWTGKSVDVHIFKQKRV